MQLKTILNHVEKQKGFVYCEARWSKALSSHARICCQPMKVLRERAPATLNILDRFHISKKFGEALDKVRAEETRQLEADGYEPILKHSRWCLLKRRENLTSKQTVKLRELLKYNLKSMKAYLMREDFNRFWTYTSPTWASKFLRDWCMRANQSQIEPMQKMAATLLKHEPLLLNWFESQGYPQGLWRVSTTKRN